MRAHSHRSFAGEIYRRRLYTGTEVVIHPCRRIVDSSTAMSTRKVIALAGVGNLGRYVCEQLVSDDRFSVVLLSRQVYRASQCQSRLGPADAEIVYRRNIKPWRSTTSTFN